MRDGARDEDSKTQVWGVENSVLGLSMGLLGYVGNLSCGEEARGCRETLALEPGN